ncbi:PAS domain S-box protein [Aquabacterium sp. CECT 9606]|uniref:PAS domain-containing hybrid sensor histidine kinase/response regulator n=1 Tax=Aquabacterium sp. CECT 9606 TaxID=2845822 RepID=UPI001E5BF04C|nr:PAS domain S-box protein [Aquabacterium sp. CECT 9606]CAH0352795.1 Sensor histidine kinase RcsC [Aquabacterium sp. CECT 9606]
MDEVVSFLGRNGYLPHGYCFTWRPELLWSMVGADLVIAGAYFSIPLAMLSFVRQRGESAMNWLIWLFCAFIFACGITHVIDVVTIWQPFYGLQAIGKVVTAIVSLITAIALWPLIPKALKIPSVDQLQTSIQSLQAEVKQRRAAEANLADTQEALVIALASIGAGFLATDREGRVTRMNGVAEQVTGWSQAQALGQPLWDVFQHEDRPESYLGRNPVDVMIENGVTIDTVHQVVAIHRDQSRTAVELKASLTHSQDGEVRGLAMVFRDMTELNQAEMKAGQLAAIVESSHDAIIGKTLEGRITHWNNGAQRLFGYTAQEAIGQQIQMLLPPERVAEEMAILAELSAGAMVTAFDTVRRAKDGTLVDVSVTISLIRNAQGQIVGASKIARDITQQKRVEQMRVDAEKLEAENRQVHAANRLKSEFLANMSHELRTPLNAIIGFAGLLHGGAVPPESPKHRDFLGHIETSGQHLLQLINDVLDLSKVEAGKLEFFPESVDLALLVSEVTTILQTSASRQGVTLYAEIDERVAQLHIDPSRLKQVLYNYLSNAIKFTRAGGQVTVRAMPEGADHFRIEVEDTGVGIAAADLSKLFIEFQQLDSSYTKRHQGTGLGLALTRRLVQAQGGHIGVRSTLGVGSVFHLVLPRSHASTDAVPSPALSSSGPRFLVIKDDHHEQSRMADALLAVGVQVDHAKTGDQAVAQAHSHPYDAITLDLILSDCRGLEALSAIRSKGPSREAPVVAVSMRTASSSAASFPVADVLSKPLETRQLSMALGSLGLTQRVGARVMVVDDDQLARDLMEATLGKLGIDFIGLSDGRQALEEMALHRPDAVILDLMMPGMDGFEVLDALRRQAEWRDMPVFIWTSMLLTADEYAHLSRSALAILTKGGASLEDLLDNLRRWKGPLAADAKQQATEDKES